MRYTLIAAAMIGAVVAMPAVQASYGETPAAYGGSEMVYGTEVSHQQTTTAALASSTCTDEAENIVPYTTPVAQSQVVESSAPAYSVPATSSVVSVVPSKKTSVASASGSMSSSEASPEMPAETPAGYASASVKQPVASSTNISPVQSAASSPVAVPMYSASSSKASPQGYASSAIPVSPESTAPVAASESEASPQMSSQYGSTIVPGSAPTAAPYPQPQPQSEGETPAAAANGIATGTVGAAMPTGTG
jgi:hypothetical protein